MSLIDVWYWISYYDSYKFILKEDKYEKMNFRFTSKLTSIQPLQTLRSWLSSSLWLKIVWGDLFIHRTVNSPSVISYNFIWFSSNNSRNLTVMTVDLTSAGEDKLLLINQRKMIGVIVKKRIIHLRNFKLVTRSESRKNLQFPW